MTLAQFREQTPQLELVVSDEVYACERLQPDLYRVVMGKPLTEHTTLPNTAQRGEPIELKLADRSFTGRCHFFGNPHVTIFTDEDPMVLAKNFGPALESHADFVDRVNVGFARQHAKGFETVVYEKGVGITQACGSGACAVGISAVRAGRVERNAWSSIELPGERWIFGWMIKTSSPCGAPHVKCLRVLEEPMTSSPVLFVNEDPEVAGRWRSVLERA